MLAGAIATNGYYCGSKLLAADESNPRGYYEDQEVNRINEHILAQHLKSWRARLSRRVSLIKDAPAGARWLIRMNHSVRMGVDGQTAEQISRLVSNAPFCFKDPRFCYTLPAWRPYLPGMCRFVVVYRNPWQTAESIVRRARTRSYGKTFPASLSDAGEIWYRAYKQVIAEIEDREQYIFVHYEDIIAGTCVPIVDQFLGTQLNTAFIDPTLNRSSMEEDRPMPRSWRHLYQKLHALADESQKRWRSTSLNGQGCPHIVE